MAAVLVINNALLQQRVDELEAKERARGSLAHWATQAGYDSFCKWVEVSAGRYELRLTVEDGVPRVPTVASLLEFGFLQAAGEIAKGGRRE